MDRYFSEHYGKRVYEIRNDGTDERLTGARLVFVGWMGHHGWSGPASGPNTEIDYSMCRHVSPGQYYFGTKEEAREFFLSGVTKN